MSYREYTTSFLKNMELVAYLVPIELSKVENLLIDYERTYVL